MITKETSVINIFRKEEWFKTLIHECVCFNLDFKSSKINFTTLFSDLFYINSSYIVNESFTEFWARILNAISHLFFIGCKTKKSLKIICNKLKYRTMLFNLSKL